MDVTYDSWRGGDVEIGRKVRVEVQGEVRMRLAHSDKPRPGLQLLAGSNFVESSIYVEVNQHYVHRYR